MNKIKNSSKNITPFGGLNFIFKALTTKKLDVLINSCLGSRSFLAQYSYSDVVLSLFANSLCQGDYLSDLQTLKSKYSDQFFTKIPSPDTVEYVCQELKTKTVTTTTYNGVIHDVNYNNNMNSSLIALNIATNQLAPKTSGYTLDFDNVVVQTEKQDAKLSYKKTKGYHPNIAFIGRLPIHIENHNGNTPASYEQKGTLERCFDNLDQYGVEIENFRADSASYQKEVINLVSNRAKNFFIRITDFKGLRAHCSKIGNWEELEINYQLKEVATTLYKPFKEDKEYRIVVTRVLKKSGQFDLLSGCAYDYYGIITNNKVLTDKDVIEFYNNRGDAENSNRYLLNDFNLHHLPFPDMDTNTVFMYLMAMSAILFEWTKIILVKNKAEGVKLNMRVKAICFHYITVASAFINHAREKIIHVYSSTKYVVLKI